MDNQPEKLPTFSRNCPKCNAMTTTKEKLTATATKSRHGHKQGFTWEACCCRCGHLFTIAETKTKTQ